MGYSSSGRRPFEKASKSSHHHIINDPEIQKLIANIEKPPKAQKAQLGELLIDYSPPSNNPIEAIVAVDGGYSEAIIDKEFPSRVMHFFQFGALLFKKNDLDTLDNCAFIAPEDMAKLNNIQRLKLSLPTRNIRLKNQPTLKASVLRCIYEFFYDNSLEESHTLIDTLAWFIFRRYKKNNRTNKDKVWKLATNPLSIQGNPIELTEDQMGTDYTFSCPETGGKIYLTDVFRLHEVIDEELGATGILGYLLNVIEHLIIVHIIRQLVNNQPEALNKVLFIKDGPTGFFGQSANLHTPMHELVNWLYSNYNINLAGLEKSGAFVEHAKEIERKLEPGKVLILSNDYIYNYIMPGQTNPHRPYGSTTYYGLKVIFKSSKNQMHVISIPAKEISIAPQASDIFNLFVVLNNIEALHCDMYDSALFPVALVNKLVSLSSHPSQRILQKFAIASIKP